MNVNCLNGKRISPFCGNVEPLMKSLEHAWTSQTDLVNLIYISLSSPTAMFGLRHNNFVHLIWESVALGQQFPL